MKGASPTSFTRSTTTGLRSISGQSGWSAFRRGALRSVPIAVGYFPIALAFGVAAAEIGVPGWAAVLMSLTTYGGASQMVALSLLATGQSLFTVILAVFVVNSRFFLLSMTLTEKIAHWPSVRKILFGSYLSDEAFALLMAGGGGAKRRFRSMECLGLVGLPMVVWVGATGIGSAAASRLGSMQGLGLDFALVALLLAVLASQLRSRINFLVVLVSGATSVGLHLLGFPTFAMILGAVSGPAVGLWIGSKPEVSHGSTH